MERSDEAFNESFRLVIMYNRTELNRKDILFSLFDATGLGLEIGPSFNPLVPKAEGYRVEILDHLSAANLREKYKSAPNVDLSKIVKRWIMYPMEDQYLI